MSDIQLERELATAISERDAARSQLARTVAEYKRVLVRAEKAEAERNTALQAAEDAREERNRIAQQVRAEWMAKCREADEERDAARAVLLEIIGAAPISVQWCLQNSETIARWSKTAGLDPA